MFHVFKAYIKATIHIYMYFIQININMEINIGIKCLFLMPSVQYIPRRWRKVNYYIAHSICRTDHIQKSIQCINTRKYRLYNSMKLRHSTGSDTSCFNVELSNVWSRDLYATPRRRQTIMAISVHVHWGYLRMDTSTVLCESILWFLKWVKELQAFKELRQIKKTMHLKIWNVQSQL